MQDGERERERHDALAFVARRGKGMGVQFVCTRGERAMDRIRAGSAVLEDNHRQQGFGGLDRDRRFWRLWGS